MAGETLAAAEPYRTQEAGPEILDPVDRAINLCANHPAKMLTLLVMAERPDTDFTLAEIRQKMASIQGSEPGWDWGRGSGATSYHQAGLIPAGLTEKTHRLTADGNTVPTYRITEQGMEWGVPLFGSLLDLELRTGLSMQKLFGFTHTGYAGSGEIRPPLLHLRLLTYIHAHSDEAVSLRTLHGNLTSPDATITRSVRNLKGVGVLQVLHKTKPADRRLAISRPHAETLARYRPFMHPANAAVHDATASLYRRGFRDVDGGQLMQEVMDFSQHRPDVQAGDVWRAITQKTPHFLKFTDAHLFGGNTGKDAPRTRIGLSSEYTPVVGELIRNIEAVRKSPAYRALAAEWAMRLLHTPASVAYLMAKARSHSNIAGDTAPQKTAWAAELKRRAVGWTSLRDLLVIDTDWRDRAACQEYDPAVFFMDSDDDISETALTEVTEAAKRVCGGCTVRMACLKQAVDTPEQYGVWGGHTPEERERLDPSFHALMGAMTIRS